MTWLDKDLRKSIENLVQEYRDGLVEYHPATEFASGIHYVMWQIIGDLEEGLEFTKPSVYYEAPKNRSTTVRAPKDLSGKFTTEPQEHGKIEVRHGTD